MSRVGARRERERVVVKPPAFGGLDRPRTEASAGRAYLVCRAGFRRPRHAARAGHRAFHSRVRSRPEMYLGSASLGSTDELAAILDRPAHGTVNAAREA